MKKLKIALGAFALIAFAGVASAQLGLWPNFPIVGGASYSCGSVNGVSNCTVAAGPTALTGNETIPANTNLSQGRSPQNVLIKPAALGALPLNWVTVTTAPAGISASNLSGGVVYYSAATITSANITLPLGAIEGQRYYVGSNRTITTLSVTAPAGDTMGTNTTPTVLTASTSVPQGYLFVYELATKIWHRLQ